MVFKIVLIGAGNLGSRHLQALKLTQREIEITVCEPNKEARNIAQKRYDEYPYNPCIKKIFFVDDYRKLSEDQDLVIVATSAQERYEIAYWCIDNLKIKYLLLEKVVFQEIKHLENIEKKLKQKEIKAWVNCPRRMYNFYRNLREKTIDLKSIDMIVSGSSWGIGCNAIHMLDLYHFLTKFKSCEYDNKKLDEGYFESKREKYVEFSGKINFNTDKGNLILKCYKDGNAPLEIILDGKQIRVEISESNRKVCMQTEENKWTKEDFILDMQFQSALTNKVVEQIVDSGTCELTKYHDSVFLHKIILSCFLNHINKKTKIEVERCPIT